MEQLTTFYRVMTSLDRVMASLQREDVDVDHLRARDLYERDLDCQNLGAFKMLEIIAAAAAERGVPAAGDHILDVGCGMGGPSRFLADRFSCAVTGIDLLELRVETAQELTRRTGLDPRIDYRVADVTDLPFEDAAFAQAWMLDVGIHVRDKTAMFSEIARVLRPGGLMVMHDQIGPLPKAMGPVTRLAPFVAPALPQLIRHVEGAGMRVLTWQDTTQHIISYFDQVKIRYGPLEPGPDENARPWRKLIRITADAYLTTLDELGGSTGIVIAQRTSGRAVSARTVS
jgi:SAM-dependent methyltransferase